MFTPSLLLSFALLIVAGCASTPHVTEQTLMRVYAKQRVQPKTAPVIFIPGLMGSILEEQSTGRTAWGRGFAGALDILALPIDAVRVTSNRDALVAKRPLDRLAWIPGLLEVDVYARIRDVTVRSGGYTSGKDAFSLSYDWRRDFVEAAQQLGELIDHVKEVWGEPDLKVDIVTHSAGGLIARYYVKYGVDDVLQHVPLPPPSYAGAAHVNQVIMLAPPNAGSFEAFQRLHEGLGIPAVGRVSTEVAFTMPSLYQLLPLDGAVFVDEAGRLLPVDLHDHENWVRYGWSVFHPRRMARTRAQFLRDDPRTGAIMYEAHVVDEHRFLKNALDRGRRFREALWQGDLDEERRRVRYVILGSGCQPTVQRAQLIPRGDEWRTRFSTGSRRLQSVLYGLGDGSVTKESLLGTQCEGEGGTQACVSRFPSAYSVFVCDTHNDLTRSLAYLDNMLHALLD